VPFDLAGFGAVYLGGSTRKAESQVAR